MRITVFVAVFLLLGSGFGEQFNPRKKGLEHQGCHGEVTTLYRHGLREDWKECEYKDVLGDAEYIHLDGAEVMSSFYKDLDSAKRSCDSHRLCESFTHCSGDNFFVMKTILYSEGMENWGPTHDSPALNQAKIKFAIIMQTQGAASRCTTYFATRCIDTREATEVGRRALSTSDDFVQGISTVGTLNDQASGMIGASSQLFESSPKIVRALGAMSKFSTGLGLGLTAFNIGLSLFGKPPAFQPNPAEVKIMQQLDNVVTKLNAIQVGIANMETTLTNLMNAVDQNKKATCKVPYVGAMSIVSTALVHYREYHENGGLDATVNIYRDDLLAACDLDGDTLEHALRTVMVGYTGSASDYGGIFQCDIITEIFLHGDETLGLFDGNSRFVLKWITDAMNMISYGLGALTECKRIKYTIANDQGSLNALPKVMDDTFGKLYTVAIQNMAAKIKEGSFYYDYKGFKTRISSALTTYMSRDGRQNLPSTTTVVVIMEQIQQWLHKSFGDQVSFAVEITSFEEGDIHQSQNHNPYPAFYANWQGAFIWQCWWSPNVGAGDYPFCIGIAWSTPLRTQPAPDSVFAIWDHCGSGKNAVNGKVYSQGQFNWCAAAVWANNYLITASPTTTEPDGSVVAIPDGYYEDWYAWRGNSRLDRINAAAYAGPFQPYLLWTGNWESMFAMNHDLFGPDPGAPIGNGYFTRDVFCGKQATGLPPLQRRRRLKRRLEGNPTQDLEESFVCGEKDEWCYCKFYIKHGLGAWETIQLNHEYVKCRADICFCAIDGVPLVRNPSNLVARRTYHVNQEDRTELIPGKCTDHILYPEDLSEEPNSSGVETFNVLLAVAVMFWRFV